MKVFVALFALVAVAAAMPAPQELPAGLTAAECPNFPYCGLTPEELVPFSLNFVSLSGQNKLERLKKETFFQDSLIFVSYARAYQSGAPYGSMLYGYAPEAVFLVMCDPSMNEL